MRATVYATGLRNVSAIAVDSRGRPWATTSAASDHSRDGLYLVAHRGAKPVLVAHMTEPLGLVWDGSALFVAARGRVYAFTHLSGDRFANRSVILDGPDPKAANDTILVLPNGRLMMSVSATCDHCRQTSRYSAAIVTFDRDGSHLRVFASGIRDGYGLALYPGTSTPLVSINQRDDLGERTPGDWLAVVRQGQNWGFPTCWGQGGSACRGVPSPLAVLERHAGAGAVAVSDNSAIVPEWATGEVERVALTGSTHIAKRLPHRAEEPARRDGDEQPAADRRLDDRPDLFDRAKLSRISGGRSGRTCQLASRPAGSVVSAAPCPEPPSSCSERHF